MVREPCISGCRERAEWLWSCTIRFINVTIAQSCCREICDKTHAGGLCMWGGVVSGSAELRDEGNVFSHVHHGCTRVCAYVCVCTCAEEPVLSL